MVDVNVDAENINIINVGSNYRIEKGPKKVTAVATAELLDNSRTASHYGEGQIDADGKPIALGEEFSYLEWGGSETERSDAWYVYEKTPVDPSDEASPYYVPEHIREAAKTKDETSEGNIDRTFYDYVWFEVAVLDSEEEAIKFAKGKAAK